MTKHAFHPGVHVATGVPVTPIADEAFSVAHAANGNHVAGAVVGLEGDITTLAHSRQLITTQVAFLLLLCVFETAWRDGSYGGRCRVRPFYPMTTAR